MGLLYANSFEDQDATSWRATGFVSGLEFTFASSGGPFDNGAYGRSGNDAFYLLWEDDTAHDVSYYSFYGRSDRYDSGDWCSDNEASYANGRVRYGWGSASHLGQVTMNPWRSAGDGGICVRGTQYNTMSPCAVDTWYHFEVKLDATNNTVTVKRDSVVVFDQTVTNYDPIAEFGMGAPNQYQVSIDHVVVWDDQGSGLTTWTGPMLVLSYVPNANGSVSGNFTGSDGNSVDNYALVDENPYSDSDYLYGSTGQRETFNFEDLSTGYEIYGVDFAARIKQHIVSATWVRPVSIESGTTYFGSESQSSPSTYVRRHYPFALTPGGSTWNASRFNAAQFGLAVQGSSTG